MAALRCTSCNRSFSRADAGRSHFKCRYCGGVALFDWTEENDGEKDVSPPHRLWRTVSGLLRPGR